MENIYWNNKWSGNVISWRDQKRGFEFQKGFFASLITFFDYWDNFFDLSKTDRRHRKPVQKRADNQWCPTKYGILEALLGYSEALLSSPVGRLENPLWVGPGLPQVCNQGEWGLKLLKLSSPSKWMVWYKMIQAMVFLLVGHITVYNFDHLNDSGQMEQQDPWLKIVATHFFSLEMST